tara:strand:- start:399 stop:638 length:240 start_codon:yes stop_codon:yes gene_type:complete
MKFFKGIWKGQKAFGEAISSLVNSVLLSIVYFLGVGLTSIFAKILKKQFLEMKIDKNKKSYWTKLDLNEKQLEDYYHQF